MMEGRSGDGQIGVVTSETLAIQSLRVATHVSYRSEILLQPFGAIPPPLPPTTHHVIYG